MEVHFLQIDYADDYTVLIDVKAELQVLEGDQYHDKINAMIEGFFYALDYATETKYKIIQIDRTDTQSEKAEELGMFT